MSVIAPSWRHDLINLPRNLTSANPLTVDIDRKTLKNLNPAENLEGQKWRDITVIGEFSFSWSGFSCWGSTHS
ncbi:hypothetical protein X802_02915 [Thermococcus guaymasensis DSM 11113]|uniref:Uncharacterized protein n=1 Tax=Thermococcus guaymasensis DSM 11113 TaxID=1432656 RepID=A0A0X1KIY8_9EURY|nr:hypothetical protein X802_02915 [Thermococcus guaymasensis DSM 11113]